MSWSKRNRHLAWKRIRSARTDDRYSENMLDWQTWLNLNTWNDL